MKKVSGNIEEFTKQVRMAMGALRWSKCKLAGEIDRSRNTVARILKGLGGDDPRAVETRKLIVDACQRAGYKFPAGWQKEAA